jgi:hypothetical protein
MVPAALIRDLDNRNRNAILVHYSEEFCIATTSSGGPSDRIRVAVLRRSGRYCKTSAQFRRSRINILVSRLSGRLIRIKRGDVV